MRDFIKSTLRFSWAMSLLGIQQLENVVEDSRQQGNKTAFAFDAIANTAEGQLAGVVENVFQAGNRMQSQVVDMVFGAGTSQPADSTSSTPRTHATSTKPVHSGRLNTTTFVVLGEGLAAGMGDFTLNDETQTYCFPAQMARQMQTDFPQRLIQPPGIGNPPGFAELPVIVPMAMQTTVLDQLPPPDINNFSVPGYRLCDALNLRPSQPLIQRHNATQTAANLILAAPSFVNGKNESLRTQLECALDRKPTLTLLEFGYFEVLQAAIKGDSCKLPKSGPFMADYERLIDQLQVSKTEIVVLTIPDPFDTAYYSSIDLAAKILKLEPATLQSGFNLKADDLISVNGISEIGFQLLSRKFKPLPEGSIVSAAAANQLSGHINDLNISLTLLAKKQEALVFDLHALFQRVKNEGIIVGSKKLTAEYLGGFYSLNGYYPGATGQAHIANELLNHLNICGRAEFPLIDLQSMMQDDPVAAYRQAEGPNWPPNAVTTTAPVTARVPTGHETSANLITTSMQSRIRSLADGWKELSPGARLKTSKPLQLPPGLEQVLPISTTASYFGDCIRAVNCRNENESRFGSCRGVLFGGFAMVDSHLSGHVRIRFTPPVNNISHFEVTHGEGLVGEDGILSAPQFFKLPALQNSVHDVPGKVSSGDLNLVTGEVSNLTYYFHFGNTALLALGRVNPNLPAPPTIVFAEVSSATQYGSANVTFEQRPDGLLDYSFYGSAFLPLGADLQGEPVQFPLPIASSTLQFASVPAKGTALHPHINISTKDPEVSTSDSSLKVPFNSLQELTFFTHNSSFGDQFTLNSPQIGGGATGRSHVLGRAIVQFGQRAGNSVPVALSFLNPGGLLADFSTTPITQLFPGRLYPGPRGFDEFLRFPLRTYSLDDLAILDDPFDISVGAVDLRTGKFLNNLLHRGFINQDLFFALIRVEPRTPQSSFYFRGPSVLERGPQNQLILRFQGEVHIPYPEGFLFPEPNFATGFPAGPSSALDPFLWVHAIQDSELQNLSKQGSEHDVLSSTAERFSYSYKIPSDLSRHKALFEYENHTQQGRFRLHSLTWVGFSNSGDARRGSGDYDTVTFTGFGIWSKDGHETVQTVAAQFSTSAQRSYVGIQINSGIVSNVNTKPPDIKDALP